MKRTTVNIDFGMLEELKKLAILHNMSQTGLLKLLLNEGIKRLKSESLEGQKSVVLPVVGEGGLNDGLDMTSRSRLWDYLDEQREKLNVRS